MRLFMIVLLVALGGLPASAAAPAGTGERSGEAIGRSTGSLFVDTFTDVCVPARLSHTGTLERAAATGWAPATANAAAQLKSVLDASDRELDAAREPGWVFRRSAFQKTVAGRSYFLIATYVHAPDVITLAGCYLYDFNATGPADTAAVTRFLGQDVDRRSPANGAMTHVWAPSPKLPRTFDTYYYEVPDGALLAERAGFTGHMLKFETSLEAPEPEPAR